MNQQGKKLEIPNFTRIMAIVVWLFGATLTYSFLDQATSDQLELIPLIALSLGTQIVLTLGQSPIWTSRNGKPTPQFIFMSMFCLITDVIINFGGAIDVAAQLDMVNSVQDISATFFGATPSWPTWVSGIIALIISIAIAGLPEYLYNLNSK